MGRMCQMGTRKGSSCVSLPLSGPQIAYAMRGILLILFSYFFSVHFSRFQFFFLFCFMFQFWRQTIGPEIYFDKSFPGKRTNIPHFKDNKYEKYYTQTDSKKLTMESNQAHNKDIMWLKSGKFFFFLFWDFFLEKTTHHKIRKNYLTVIQCIFLL